jgi:hypothetical protein
MLKLDNNSSLQDQLNWHKLRKQQLKWYGGDIVLQDQELLNFVEYHNIQKIRYIGDSKHVELVVGRKSDPGEMCVYMIKSPFELDHVVEVCNQELDRLEPGGILYLSLNKFLLEPCALEPVNPNYDATIYDFVVSHMRYPVIRYHSGIVDGGQRFNWIHPLTRFYFINENTHKNSQ